MDGNLGNRIKKNKAVITGVSSFVGMHLARIFSDANWEVMAIITKPLNSYTGVRLKRLNVLRNNVNFITGDILETNWLKKIVGAFQPNIWIHHVGYTENYSSQNYNLQKSLAINVLSLEPLYQQLMGGKCGVIITGSSMEYSICDVANKENDTCWPKTSYGVSKLAQTIEARRLAVQYEVPTRVARLYIPVGTLDSHGKLIGSVMKALRQNKRVNLSACNQKRDFLGVNDIGDAYIKLAEDFPRKNFDIFNICSGEAISLKDFLMLLCNITKTNKIFLDFGAQDMRVGEPLVSYGDNTKARLLLDWHPGSLNEALKFL